MFEPALEKNPASSAAFQSLSSSARLSRRCPQSLIVAPESPNASPTRGRNRDAVRECVANCALLESQAVKGYNLHPFNASFLPYPSERVSTRLAVSKWSAEKYSDAFHLQNINYKQEFRGAGRRVSVSSARTKDALVDAAKRFMAMNRSKDSTPRVIHAGRSNVCGRDT